jgi:trehalose/maltose transport system permease protein
MSTAAETTTAAVVRPVSRSVRIRRSPLGRVLIKLPFWFLILAIAVYALFPFYWALRSAITPDTQLFTTPVTYFPSHPTWAHFHDALSSSFFRKALLNSTIVAGSVTLLSLAIGSVAAYALGRFRFRGKSFVLYLMLSMTIFPQIAILGALYTMFSGFHIVGPIDFPKLYDTLGALVFS